jgi:two-component system sensor histidine kinase and response regulator WspE
VNPPENSSSFHAIKQEINAQAAILREAIVAMQNNPKASDFLAVAVKSTQLLLQLLKEGHCTFLIPLIENLERYFRTVQAGMPIKEKHLETLSAVVAELGFFSNIKKNKAGKLANVRQSEFDELRRKLRQYIYEFEIQHPVQIEGQSEQKKSDEKAPPPVASTPNEAIVELFLNELLSQIQALRQSIAVLHSEPQSASSMISLIQTVQSIGQAATIVGIGSLIELIKSLEEYLKAIKEKKTDWNSEGEEVINFILNFLEELSHLAPDRLNAFMQEQEESVQRLLQQLRQVKQFQKSPSAKTESQEEVKKEPQTPPALIDVSFESTMFDLFNVEVETQCKVLNQGLIELERKPKDQNLLESLMRAAHSIKGAARVVSLSPIVQLAHAMEDCFVAAQNQKLNIEVHQIDQLLRGVDFLMRLSKVDIKEMSAWLNEQLPFIESLTRDIIASSVGPEAPEIKKETRKVTKQETHLPSLPLIKVARKDEVRKVETKRAFQASFNQDRVLRITAQNLNRLMGLAGESLVESRWLYPFGEGLQTFKNNLKEISTLVDLLRENIKKENLNEIVQTCLTELNQKLNEIRYHLSSRLVELDNFIRRHASLSDRLYQEVINSRMRPFADGVEAFPRMVRDLAHQLGKRVKLEIEGKSTLVDRDILEKLESPLSHLLRNAVDHGIESPEERGAIGKPAEGVIRLEARHRGGMLAITVTDDGKGIDIEQLRRKIVERNLVSSEMANRLTDSEVIDFLFLPGFSTSASVTEISGRGVGLNVVQSTVQEVGGVVQASFIPGKGMTFYLQLPLTLSVIRALLVEISGEAYAFPLARIDQTFLVNRENIELIENRQFFHYEGQNIGLIAAWQVLELGEPQFTLQRLPVIVVSDRYNSYGIVVDRLMGEKELVVQELDPRLGKIPDISAGALMEDGSPILIIDVEDIVSSIDNFLSGGRLAKVAFSDSRQTAQPKKRILIVDDSITVREVECRLLQNQGYEIETAVNGIDGWNAVRIGHYDLVITDVDMPRMNGIELLRAIKSDPKLHDLPVMIVSYKADEGDRLKGLEAGADYYLTKSSFHDATLIEAVHDLIGMP